MTRKEIEYNPSANFFHKPTTNCPIHSPIFDRVVLGGVTSPVRLKPPNNYLRYRLQARSLVILTVLCGIFVLNAEPSPPPRPGEEVLQRYLANSEHQRMALRNISIEVSIEANLPQLKKKGTLNGLRHISKLGKISYKVTSFVGDKMVRNDVIARYMSAEAKATDSNDNRSMSINEENYKFNYRGDVRETVTGRCICSS